MSSIDDLLEDLDAAASTLLKRAMGGGLEAEGTDDKVAPEAVTVGEQVRIFSAVRAYAESRAKAETPKEQGASKFDDIKRRFNGSPSSGRGTSRKAKSPSANGHDSFDA